ncbi:DUF6602 domain-containing protein [Pseudomonas sp. TNT2022 ID642]|jgi:hypothetical protein|uniref:DUF6602 domain-containing protein n=1 Tax=Pseudomonas sp. TNT2022 ID642 TaxID=2942632 RepID=UPI002361002B|nr:DUF6602 domain-containing protein [Pseudomonas sp. TNT2022 ID642]MDD1001959.1 hypothetical protein [Pseudomonas sp. TNT2022 ID642]
MKDYYKSRTEDPAGQITNRMEGSYHRFLAGFTETKAINHSLSKGEQRENPIKDFFEELLPRRFSVTSGEIFDSKGNISPQSDLIIYRTIDGIPVLNQQPTILQSESVMCVTEVKSVINTEAYKDCLIKAKKLFELKPFGKPLQMYERGRDPSSEECRYFISIFAYSSNIKGSLKDEYKRYKQCAEEAGIDEKIIDRIYILGKGIINPSDKKVAADTENRKIGLFYFYSNLLQFATREAIRRKEVPHIAYFGRMSEGWENVK